MASVEATGQPQGMLLAVGGRMTGWLRAAITVLVLVLALACAAVGVAVTMSNLAHRSIPVTHSAQTKAAQTKPNIVLILVDDMREDDLRFMPETRRLIGDHGARFDNSFAPFPLCCPARASILSGLYPHNHGVLGVGGPYGFHAFDDRSTVATWLQSAGYATILVGKYLNGYGRMPLQGRTSGNSVHYVPPGWTSWHASIDGGLPDGDPREGGTYRYFDTTLSDDGAGFWNFRGQYQTKVYGDLTEQIIGDRAPSSQPFFLYVAYSAPHTGGPRESDDPVPMRRHGHTIHFGTPARPDWVKGRFNNEVRAAPGSSWDDPDFKSKPSYLRRRLPLDDAEKQAVLEITLQRAEALWVVDQQVRRTVDALQKAGELDNTLLVFTSDNGYFLGEQRMPQGKIYPHEPSLRVPMLMRGPGIPAAQLRHDPIASIDLGVTFAAAAGVTPPNPVDGISMLNVARHGDLGWTRPILTETGPMFGVRRTTDQAGRPLSAGGPRDKRYLIGVRTPRFLYVDVATGEKELYDLASDPREYVNRANDPAFAHVQALLEQTLSRYRDCTGSACAAPMPLPLRGGSEVSPSRYSCRSADPRRGACAG